MSIRTPDPHSGPTTAGLDVSHWQSSSVDWKKVATVKRYAQTRSGDGLGTDETFQRNYKGARDAGMIVGAYEYVRPTLAVQDQAKHLLDQLAQAGFGPSDLPPMLDVERTGVHSNDGLEIAEAMLLWLHVVESALKVRPLIYAGAFFASNVAIDHMPVNGKMRPALAQALTQLAGYPVMSPAYVKVPVIGKPWTHWTFWQFTDQGPVDGVPSKGCDQSVFRGDLRALQEFVATSRVIPGDTAVCEP